MSTVNQDQARAILKSLFPPGQLYDWDNSNADVYKLLDGLAAAWKMYGFDLVDILRAELMPSTIIAKLPDWEAALGLVNTSGKTTTQRQTAVISKLRESGASTISNLQTVLAPLLGYTTPSQLQILEVSRSALTSAHTYSISGTFNIAASGSQTFTLSTRPYDGGAVSPAGVRLGFTVSTGVAYQSLQVALTAPSGTTYTWPASALAQAGQATTISTGVHYLYTSTFNGTSALGTWTVQFTNNAGSTFSLSEVEIFVEGVEGPQFRSDFSVLQETGGAIFDWGAYADPALINSPDYAGTVAAIGRIKPAHTLGRLILSETPYPDTTSGTNSAIPDQCLPV